MDIYTTLFLVGAAIILPVMLVIGTSRSSIGNPLLAGSLCISFGVFSAFTIAREGVVQVVFNHNLNFWGTQVWYDLVIAVSIALFFVVPRARAVGMNIWP